MEGKAQRRMGSRWGSEVSIAGTRAVEMSRARRSAYGVDEARLDADDVYYCSINEKALFAQQVSDQ
jgi:hypothetical protein